MSSLVENIILFFSTLIFVGFMSAARPTNPQDDLWRLAAASGEPIIVAVYPKEVEDEPEVIVKSKQQETFEKAIEKAIEEQTVIDEDLIKMVKHFEGFEQTTTYDTDGAMMIGHGFRKEDIPDLKLGDTITKEEAHEVLLRVLGRFGCHVDKTIEVPISKHQRNAMTSFAYNIGPNAFKGSFVAKETNKKNYERAADCFRYWRHVKVDGKKIVSKGLMRRRAAEKLMYLRKAEL